MGKKGQITLFIIIGVILILIIGITTYVLTKPKEEFVVPVVEEVPVEFQPISSFVEQCVIKVGEEGLRRIGDQGGYVDIINEGLLVNDGEPTEGEAVSFSPGSDLIMPYWWYLKTPNDCAGNCEFGSKQPDFYYGGDEPTVQTQIEEYVNDNLRTCLGDFEVFKDQGFSVRELGDINTDAILAEDFVGLHVEYPIEVTKVGTKEINEYYISLPVDLKRMFELGTRITSLQSQNLFIEKDVLNLIVGFSGVDMDKLPPMSASQFSFAPTTVWAKTLVKERVTQVLESYIQMLQVYGSKSYDSRDFGGDTLSQGLYGTGMTVYTNETSMEDEFNNIDVRFTYLGFWRPYFDLNCDGEICRPESMSSNLAALIGVQRYNFLYDLSFPVMVEIKDPNAFNKKGYALRFFLEANIRDNEPLTAYYVPLTGIPSAAESMLCDDAQRNTGNFTIDVTDANTKEPVDDVQVVYSCIEEHCVVGTAKNGKMKEEFPVCFGGVMNFVKDGYLTKSEMYSTELDEEADIKIEMEPLKTFTLEVRKIRVSKTPAGWVVEKSSRLPMEEEDTAIVNFKREAGLMEEEYTTSARAAGTELGEVRLAKGKYNVSVNLLTDKYFEFLPKERCEGGSLFTKEKCTDIPPEKMTFNESFPSGGSEFDYRISPYDLENNKMIVYAFYTDYYSVDVNELEIEDLEQLAKIEEYSQKYWTKLIPDFEQ